MAKVYLKFNSAIIKEIKLDKDEITFGRKSGNDIVIDHPTISGFHGKIKKDGDNFVVEDLGSTNGTFLRGQKIKSGTLKDGDQLGVAGHILEFHISDTTPITTAPPSTPINEQVQAASQDIEAQKQMLKDAMGIGKTPEKEPEGIIKKTSSWLRCCQNHFWRGEWPNGSLSQGIGNLYRHHRPSRY
jgi:pSer/pThr/pTyr-binding forkhead associated (FHA) protein